MADEHDVDETQDDRPAPPRPPGEGVRIIGAQEAAAREAEMKGRLPEDHPRFGDVPPQPSGPRPAVRFPLPEDAEPAPVVAPTPDLPHWTEPPTGEVPRILAGSDEEEDDLEAWSGLTSRQPRWREGNDWEEADFDDASLLAGDDEERMGALDEHRAERDVFTFDGPDAVYDDEEPAPVGATSVSSRPRTTRIRTRPEEPPDYGTTNSSDRDLPVAIAAGVGLLVVALLAFKAGPKWAAVLATVVVVLCAVEAFDAFRRAGHRPATLLGLVATGSLMLGTYVRGERAVPLILALAVVFTLLWFLFGAEKARPTTNVGITLLAVGWVGFLGSFATLLLRYPNREGIAFLLGAILAVVANDVGALFVGRQFGSTPLAGEISPNKSWEGFAGGFAVTLVVCLAVVRAVHPWTLVSAFLLAIVVSVIGPLGDLCESMIKRDLGLKDMSSFLPGHGGVLDRFDALLFALPAVYYLVELLNLAGK
jgi:phosphatidate cytidylyltransferase